MISGRSLNARTVFYVSDISKLSGGECLCGQGKRWRRARPSSTPEWVRRRRRAKPTPPDRHAAAATGDPGVLAGASRAKGPLPGRLHPRQPHHSRSMRPSPFHQGVLAVWSSSLLGAAMRKFWLAAVILVIATTAHAAEIKGKPARGVDALFRVDTFNSNREYVEHMIGPAKYVDSPYGKNDISSRTYIVDGCAVEIGYRNDSVRYLGLKGVSEKCRFPVSRFVPHTPATHIADLTTLTFGMFEKQVGFSNAYSVECLASCGNSADPSVSLFHQGAHVDEFIDILLEQDYPYSDRVTDKSLDQLENVIMKSEPSDYLTAGLLTCDRKYQPLEREMFKNSKVKNVYVGFDLEGLLPKCGS